MSPILRMTLADLEGLAEWVLEALLDRGRELARMAKEAERRDARHVLLAPRRNDHDEAVDLPHQLLTMARAVLLEDRKPYLAKADSVETTHQRRTTPPSRVQRVRLRDRLTCSQATEAGR